MTAQPSGPREEPEDFPLRIPEVDLLVEVLVGEHYAGAVILGGPGLGKSSLVQTSLEITGRAADVVYVQCSQHLREVSYGALSPLLTALPELATPVDVLRSLQQLGADQVIVVLDVHYLDAASGFVLAQLVQNRAAKLLAIGTAALGRESGIAALADTVVLRTIHMKPADSQRVRRQCEQILGGPLTEGAVRTVHGMTGGNPRLINAFLASARDQGVLVRAPDGAALPGRATPWILLRPAPDPDGRLIDTVETLHAALRPGESETLDLVSLAGRVSRPLVRAVTGEHVQDLMEAGFLRETSANTVGLSAAVHAEVLRARIPPGRSFDLYKRWRSVTGDAAEHRTARSILWALECGQYVPTDQIMEAGYLALQVRDWPTARSLAAALTDVQEPRAALLVAELMLAGGRAWAARTELENLASQSEDPDFRIEVLSLLAMDRVRTGESPSPWEALPRLINSVRTKMPQQPFQSEALHQVVDLLLKNAVDEHRSALLEQSQRLIDETGTAMGTRAVMLILHADLLLSAGQPDIAIPATRRAYDLASTIPSFSSRFGLDALVYLVLGYLSAGYPDEARRVLHDNESLEPRHWYERSGTVMTLQYLVDSTAGVPGDATSRLEDAVVELRHHDPAQMLQFAEALLAPQRAALTVGLPSPTAEERAAEAPYGPPGRWLMSLALFSLAEDRHPDAAVQARPLWRRILNDPRLEGEPFIRRDILLAAILLRDPLSVEKDVAAELCAVAVATGGPRSAALAQVLDPALAADTQGLTDAAESAASSGEILPAALGWARLIVLHHQAGDLRRRGEALRRLQHLQARAGVVFPPFVAGALALGELTAREHEIVGLVKQGLSNAAVAEKLFLSQRTVEGHLYRAFTKLGITERTDLRDLQF